MCSALGRLSVNSAGSSWELVVWGFFFFQWTEAERSMGTFFAFPGVGESLFSLS